MSKNYPVPPFSQTKQSPPGETDTMSPCPDHGEQSYEGHGRLAGKAALITDANSGIPITLAHDRLQNDHALNVRLT